MSDLSKDFSETGPIAETEVPREFIGTMLVADPFYPGVSAAIQDGITKSYSLRKQVVLPIVEFHDPAHQEDCILGIVINIQDEDTPDLKSLALRANLDFIDENKNVPCLFGGPVNKTDFYLVTEDDFSKSESSKREKVGHLMISHDEGELVDIIAGNGPGRFAFSTGVVRWTRSELADQIKKGFFHVTEIHSDLLFDTPIEERWDRALEKIGFDRNRIAGISNPAVIPPICRSRAYN